MLTGPTSLPAGVKERMPTRSTQDGPGDTAGHTIRGVDYLAAVVPDSISVDMETERYFIARLRPIAGLVDSAYLYRA